MKFGDVVLVKFPFSDLDSAKKRPALLLVESRISDKVSLATIAMITSRLDGLKFPGDYKIKSWETSGLLHPSVLRLSKVATIDSNMISKVLGQFNDHDILGSRTSFKKLYKACLPN